MIDKQQITRFVLRHLAVLTMGLLVLSGCEKDPEIDPVEPCSPPTAYSFFVAGHTYGSPVDFQLGLHPPFKSYLPNINAYPGMSFGVFTGDVVPKPTAEYFDAIEADFELIDVPVAIAPGNHDRSAEFQDRFGPGFGAHRVGNDLFLVLNTFKWSVEGEQLDFVRDVLDSLGSRSDHIFVFAHELVWWAPENHFSTVGLNAPSNYWPENNYWETVEPLFQKAAAPVYFFAGDIGANSTADAALYHEEGNITYIANGMGHPESDSFIYVDVLSNGRLQFTLEALGTDDPRRLGNLEDYPIPEE